MADPDPPVLTHEFPLAKPAASLSASPMTGPTTLFHMSDIHFGVEDRGAVAWFEEAVHREKPAAVICTGDLTQRATHEQFAAATEFFESLPVPVTLEPGNHDMPYYNLWERFTQPYKRYGALVDAVHRPLEFDDLVLVPLKTTVRIQPRFPWSDGFVKREALAETVAALSNLKADKRFKMVTCHHPLIPAQEGGKNPTLGGDEAFAQLAAAGSDAVLSGHVHLPFDLFRESEGAKVRMIGAGTLSTRLRGAVPSYNVLTYNTQDGLKVERRDFEAASAS
jgi:3',5'-cyclic AMP phosphodiesterase CpdA